MFFWVKNTNHVYSFTAFFFFFFLEGGGGAFWGGGGKNAFCPPTFLTGGATAPPAPPPTSGANPIKQSLLTTGTLYVDVVLLVINIIELNKLLQT